MKPETITSLQNPKIKNVVKLRQRKHRDRQRLMLIDGARELGMALNSGFLPETIFVWGERVAQHAELLARATAQSVRVQPVTAAVFRKIGYGDNPDGILAVAPQPDFPLDALPCPPDALFLVAEGVEKPGNLGAMLRSADAAGVTALILCDSATDICNPNTIRASRGAFFTVPIAAASTADTLRWLHANSVQIVAASPAGKIFHFEVDFRPATAIAVGAEHSGLTARWFDEILVKIPMFGQIDSLNVAQSASILLFEAVRQRLVSSFKFKVQSSRL